MLSALLFTKSTFYVNTARVDLSLLGVENSCLSIADSKFLTICIMTGTVTESYLKDSVEAEPCHSSYGIHKMTIAPFEQDFWHNMLAWGMKFGFHIIVGIISPSGFGFATRGEEKGDSFCMCPFFPICCVLS